MMAKKYRFGVLIKVIIFIIVLSIPQILLYGEFMRDSLLYDDTFYRMKYKGTYISKGDFMDGYRYHWNKHGITSGQVASPVFDVKYFLEKNPDLKKVYGNNYVEASKYFKEHGIKEGRESSPVFSINYYRKNNRDLASLSNLQLIEHYVKHGIEEGRRAHPEFDIQAYLIQYQKSTNASKIDYRAALYHYLIKYF